MCSRRLILKPGDFIDKCRIYVRGGKGGNGLAKYGGRGGKGSDVYIVAKKNITLKNIVYSDRNPLKRYTANDGQRSTDKALLGRKGKDLEIRVPHGISVEDDSGKVLGELNAVGERLLVARGGEGGSLQNSFIGQRGESTQVTLNLRLIADIGLVGFPNAGKSTFLGAISRANPQIAEYAFTTIKPQIGTLNYPDHRSISVADLPGLIEGAHVNVGMGHHFLKHVERTKLLLFMVDLYGFQLNPDLPFRTPISTIILLNKELELYNESLVDKPCLLILNKVDKDIHGEENAEETLRDVENIEDIVGELDPALGITPRKIVQFDETFVISAKMGVNISYVRERLRHWLDLHSEQTLPS